MLEQESHFSDAKLTKVNTAPGPLPHSTPTTPRSATASYPSCTTHHSTDARTTIRDAHPPRDDALHIQRLGPRTGRQGARLVAARGARLGDHGRSRRRARSAAAGFGLLRQLVCLPPRSPLSCPSEPCADACGLPARSDAYTCPDSGSGGSSCDDACNAGCRSSCDDWCDNLCTGSCDWFGTSCDSSCDGSCDRGCDGGCTSSCDGGCDTCNSGREYYSCDSGCTSGCSACPYGQYSAASTSLVSTPLAPWPSRQASPRPTPRVSSAPHTATPHARTITHTTQLTVCTACARRPGAAHLQC